MFLQAHSRPTALSRATAALCVLLVLLLAVLASSPDLHERFHARTSAAASAATPAPPGGDEDGCVVTVFAQGLVLAIAVLCLALAGIAQAAIDFAAIERIAPRAPRYFQLPSQAPPAP